MSYKYPSVNTYTWLYGKSTHITRDKVDGNANSPVKQCNQGTTGHIVQKYTYKSPRLECTKTNHSCTQGANKYNSSPHGKKYLFGSVDMNIPEEVFDNHNTDKTIYNLSKTRKATAKNTMQHEVKLDPKILTKDIKETQVVSNSGYVTINDMEILIKQMKTQCEESLFTIRDKALGYRKERDVAESKVSELTGEVLILTKSLAQCQKKLLCLEEQSQSLFAMQESRLDIIHQRLVEAERKINKSKKRDITPNISTRSSMVASAKSCRIRNNGTPVAGKGLTALDLSINKSKQNVNALPHSELPNKFKIHQQPMLEAKTTPILKKQVKTVSSVPVGNIRKPKPITNTATNATLEQSNVNRATSLPYRHSIRGHITLPSAKRSHSFQYDKPVRETLGYNATPQGSNIAKCSSPTQPGPLHLHKLRDTVVPHGLHSTKTTQIKVRGKLFP